MWAIHGAWIIGSRFGRLAICLNVFAIKFRCSNLELFYDLIHSQAIVLGVYFLVIRVHNFVVAYRELQNAEFETRHEELFNFQRF